MSDSDSDSEMQHNLNLPTTEDAVDELLLSGTHNGTITEFEKPNWFAAHRNGYHNIQLREEIGNMENEMDAIIAGEERTDIEISFTDMYRPIRSHFPPIPCLMVFLTPESGLAKQLRLKLRAFSQKHSESLKKIKGLCVFGYAMGNINGRYGNPKIGVLANVIECLTSAAQLQLNLVQIQVDDSDEPCAISGQADDFSKLARVFDSNCRNLTFFRFHANIAIEETYNDDDERADLDSILMVLKSQWSPLKSDYFSINSHNFLHYVEPFSIQHFFRHTPIECKIRITCRNDSISLVKLVDGTSFAANEDHLNHKHLYVFHSYPIDSPNENAICKLLRANKLFPMITIGNTGNTGGMVSNLSLQNFWKATFIGFTQAVQFDLQPTFNDGNDIIQNTIAHATQTLPNNTNLEIFDPFQFNVAQSQHNSLMNTIQPILDNNHNRARRQQLPTS